MVLSHVKWGNSMILNYVKEGKLIGNSIILYHIKEGKMR